MTPEDKQRDMAAERAEKILSFVDDWFNLTIPERKQMLAAEITAAVNDAIKDAIMAEQMRQENSEIEKIQRAVEEAKAYKLSYWQKRINEAKAEAFAEGKRVAYEDAAQIVADAPENTYMTDCDHASIAEEIRARAKEVAE